MHRVAISEDGLSLAINGKDSLTIYREGVIVNRIPLCGRVSKMGFSPSGEYLAYISKSKSLLRVCYTCELSTILQIGHPLEEPMSFSWSPCSEQLLFFFQNKH